MQVLFWFVVLSLFAAAAALGIIAWRAARGVRERDLARAELLRALSFPGASTEPASGATISDWTAPATVTLLTSGACSVLVTLRTGLMTRVPSGSFSTAR